MLNNFRKFIDFSVDIDVIFVQICNLQLMRTSVGSGEELMPSRNLVNLPNDSGTDSVAEECEAAAAPTTPIRKLCRNRGLVLQENAVVEDSPENDDAGTRAAVIRKGKRKVR